MDDFIPSEFMSRVMRWWWLVILLMIAGGMAGVLAVKLQKPVYESQASITTSIDFAYSGRLTEDQEDHLIRTVGDIITSSDVFAEVKTKSSELEIALTDEAIRERFTEARQGYRWELTVRDSDPKIAQALTQIWVEAADEALVRFHAKSQEILAVNSAQLALQNCFSQSVVVEPASAYCSIENLATIREVLTDNAASEEYEALPDAIVLSKISTEITDNAYLPENPVILKRNLTTLIGSFCGLLIGLGFLVFGKNK